MASAAACTSCRSRPSATPTPSRPTISQVLGVREGASGTPLTALREYLHSVGPRPDAPLLDGFEHLMAAALLVAELVKVGPKLKILVTSRSPLHIYGEHEFPVPPLAVPDRTAGVRGTVMRRCRQPVPPPRRRRQAGLRVDRGESDRVAEICTRLDGLPLAIELAAARVKLLSPAAMRTRLEKRLQLLTGGARDLPARQQTLRGARSTGAMSCSARPSRGSSAGFRCSSGGCTLEAAEAVCDTKSDLELDLLDGVASLMDKSLLQKTEPRRRRAPLRHARNDS